MKRLVLLVLLLGLVLSACGSGGVAATVNGTDITVDDIDELVPSDGAIPQDQFIATLQNQIILIAVADAAESELDIVADDTAVEEQYQAFVVQIEASGGGDYETGLAASQVTDAFVRDAAKQQVLASGLSAHFEVQAEEVTDEDVAAAVEEDRSQYVNACVSHILVETEGEAADVKSQLDAFEPTADETLADRFASLASELSIDPSAATNGGSLGCQPLSAWVPEFAAGVENAEIGAVAGPVESDFGFHLILVDSVADDDESVTQEARTQLESAATSAAQAASSDALVAWVDGVLQAADIELDPEYGEWVDDPQPGIQPPADDSTTSTASTD